ncbi:MAG TPA: hypothetical protein VGH19_03410 [Verrucomicrobiae bacterium]
MRLLFATLLTFVLVGCSHRPATSSAELADFIAELKRDIPIRAGMTIEQVKSFITENNQRIRDSEPKWSGKFEPPIYSRPELHLYIFLDMSNPTSPSDRRSLTYLANGRYQFWMDMAIHDGRIKNIYIAPGNLSHISLPAFLYDGAGEHIGMLADQKQ